MNDFIKKCEEEFDEMVLQVSRIPSTEKVFALDLKSSVPLKNWLHQKLQEAIQLNNKKATDLAFQRGIDYAKDKLTLEKRRGNPEMETNQDFGFNTAIYKLEEIKKNL